MIKLIGIFNIIFLVSVMGFLILKSHRFSFKRNTLSRLIKYTKYKTLFEVTLFLFSLNQVILCILVYLQFNSVISIYSLILFVIGGIFLGLASFLTVIKHPYLHMYSALICGAFVFTGLISYGVSLINVDVILGSLLLLVTIPIPLIYLFKRKFKGGYWEVVILMLIFCCNIVVTLLLLK